MSLILFAGCTLVLGACSHATEEFESVVQVLRRTAVERNDKDEETMVDVELEWDPCPGDQFQVIRGSKVFAACTQKYKKGDYVAVHVSHFWDPHGFYRWDITQMGDCNRDVEIASEGSYEKSQECSDDKAYGNPVGFTCSRKPFRKLVAVCPWMARQ